MMQQDYKKTIKDQHAPEHLIQKTVIKMQEEKRKARKPFPVKGLAAAACVVLVAAAGIMVSQLNNSKVPFYQIEQGGGGKLGFGLIQMNQQIWDIQEFAAETGWNIENLAADGDIRAVAETDGSISIKGTFLYSGKQESCTLQVIKNKKLSAKRYAGEKSVDIGSRAVYFAEDPQNWYAFYEEENAVLVSVEKSKTLDADYFVKMIKNILEK